MKTQKDLLYLSISCFIVIAAWVGFHIYNIYVTSTITQDLQQQSQPIDPHFDTDLLTKLKTRQQIVPHLDAVKGPASPTPLLIPVTQTPSASNSGAPTLQGQ